MKHPIARPLEEFDKNIRRFPHSRLDALFSIPPRGTLKDRFSIYATGYGVRTRDSMEEIYEALPVVMGEKKWLELGYQYTNAYPSKSYNLGDIGHKLPQFLKAKNFSRSFVELAKFELKLWQSFHASEMKTEYSIQDLVRLSEKSIFQFQSSFEIFHSDFKVAEAWRNKANKIRRGKEYSVIFRTEFQVRVDIVTFQEWQILSGLSRGLRLGKAIDRMTRPPRPEILSAWLHKWANHLYFFSFQ